MKEYYYIDFNDLLICSWDDDGTELDKANKIINNYFLTYDDAHNALKKIMKNEKDCN